MKDNGLIEFRWHGRGGQGAKTACLLLADAAFASGKYVQGFPEYGPERMGAPITAYNRISDAPCTIHSNIYEPDYVVVVDESLLSSVDVTAGLSPKGAIVINSPRAAGGSAAPAAGLFRRGVRHRRPEDLRGAPGGLLSQHPHALRDCTGQPRAGARALYRGYGGILPPQIRHQAPGHPGQYELSHPIHEGGAGRMSIHAKDINEHTPWQEMTPGGEIYEGGTARA